MGFGAEVSLENLNKLRNRSLHVDLIRTIAMVGVILFHATGHWTISSQELNQMNLLEITSWCIVVIYQSIGAIAVPLFLMLSGALLLQPQKKDETLRVFFKKRWTRIGLPFFFWSVAYFVWDFLVQKIPFSADVILQGLLNGAYTHFWYIYVLVGLYFLTPLLRTLLANADKALMKYFLILWVVGVAVMPFLDLLSPFRLNGNVFAFSGYVGFFVLGTYLTTVKLRRSIICFCMFVGITLTAFGTYVLATTGVGGNMYFFQEYLSPTVILAAVMLFLLLLTVKPPVQQAISSSKGNKLFKVVSENTLPIFFLHVMVLESIQNGYFGFTLNRNILTPVIEAPLMTAIVLFTTLGVVFSLKKIPYLNKLIG